MLPAPASRVTERSFRRLRFLAVATVGLVIGHDAVFIAEFGPSSPQALAATGHGYWYSFAILALLLAGIPIGAAVIGLLRLRRRLRRVESAGWTSGPPLRRIEALSSGMPAGATWAGEFRDLAPRLFLTIATGFLIQENLEHLAAGDGLPGLWVLAAPFHALAIPVLAGLTALLAAAAAWVRWRGTVLSRRLALARELAARIHARAMRVATAWHTVAAIVAHGWILARRLAGRAPPVSLPA